MLGAVYEVGPTPTQIGVGSRCWVDGAGNFRINDPTVDRASAGRSVCTVYQGGLICPEFSFQALTSPSGPIVDGGLRISEEGFHQACALDTAGAVYCWNPDWQSSPDSQPQRYFESGVVLALATNFYTQNTCAVYSDGSLWCTTAGVPGTETRVQPQASVKTTCQPN